MLRNPNASLIAIAIAAPLLIGCGGSGGGSSELDAMADLLDEKAVVDAEQDAADALAASQAEVDALQAKANALRNEAPSEITTDDMVRGAKLEGGGYLKTTLKAGIRGEQKLGMSLIQHSLALFNASESRWPEDHAEFLEKIVEFNEIKLEPLKEPYEYIYDPELDPTQPLKRPSQAAIEAAQAAADAARAALQG